MEEDKDLAARLKDSAGKGFGCSLNQIHRATLVFDSNRGISQLWGEQKMSAGRDWFAGFMERNGNIALRKPEGLSRARAQGKIKKVFEDHFQYG
jgi:hypothetical protein